MLMTKYISKSARKLLDKIKFQDYLNIAKKAGYVIIGGEKLYTYNKKIYLIIYDSTAGTSTLKLVEKFKEKGISILSIEDLESYMKIKNCKIIAIKNKDISEILYNNAKF